MSLQGVASENLDKSKDYSIGIVKGDNDASLSATVFVKGYYDVKPTFMKPDSPNYKTAGIDLTGQSSGHVVSLSAQHAPGWGDSATAAAVINVINKNDHKVDVNAFTTMNMPKSGSNFGTHGAGVNYMYKETFGAGASISKTPMYQHKETSVMGKLNLHETPNSSLSFNLGATKVESPFSNKGWQPGASFGFTKTFK